VWVGPIDHPKAEAMTEQFSVTGPNDPKPALKTA